MENSVISETYGPKRCRSIHIYCFSFFSINEDSLRIGNSGMGENKIYEIKMIFVVFLQTFLRQFRNIKERNDTIV